MIANPTLFLLLLVIENYNNYESFKQVGVAINDKESIFETLKWIVHDPTHHVFMYHGYVINGCNYHTKDHDEL